METPATPLPTTAALHGPYEDLVIAALTILGKLIDGQTPEQKAILWKNWIDFWQPAVNLIVKKP